MSSSFAQCTPFIYQILHRKSPVLCCVRTICCFLMIIVVLHACVCVKPAALLQNINSLDQYCLMACHLRHSQPHDPLVSLVSCPFQLPQTSGQTYFSPAGSKDYLFYATVCIHSPLSGDSNSSQKYCYLDRFLHQWASVFPLCLCCVSVQCALYGSVITV